MKKHLLNLAALIFGLIIGYAISSYTIVSLENGSTWHELLLLYFGFISIILAARATILIYAYGKELQLKYIRFQSSVLTATMLVTIETSCRKDKTDEFSFELGQSRIKTEWQSAAIDRFLDIITPRHAQYCPASNQKKISKLHQELKELSAKINGLPDNPTSNQDNLLNLWQLYESVIKRSAELSHNIEIINKVHAQFEKMHIHTRVA